MSELWEFKGGNGCPKCQALTGRYEHVPVRPHDYCDCEIGVPEDASERDCFDWDLDILENNMDVDVGEERHMKVRAIVTCCNGRQTEQEFEKSWTHEGYPGCEGEMNREIFQEAQDWAESQLQLFCIGTS
jgi:hypothetical protein